MTAVKAITVRNPWAEAIASGAKTVENRASGTTWRGILFIHTSQQLDRPACLDRRIMRALWGSTDLTDKALLALADGFDGGEVIAVGRLVDVHDAATIPTLIGPPATCCEPWGERLHGARTAKHLVLANVRRLNKPVPARGALGLWKPDENTIGQVRHELAEAAPW